MYMKITNLFRVFEVNPTEKAKEVERVNKTDRKIDEVALSDQARLFQVARNAIHEIDDIRMDKVNSIKDKIDNNTYSVDPEEIADKFLDQTMFW